MKKLLVPALISAVFTGTLFTSCQDVIFDTIRDEIALDDAQVTGDINSIVRFTYNDSEYLFVQNGTIWMKDVNDAATGTPTALEPATGYNGNWTQISQPAQNIIKLAADSTYLYALAAPTESDTDDTGENIETGRIVYYTKTPEDADSWKAIKFGDTYGGSTISTSYNVVLFCTNTPQQANRHAYVNIGNAVIYELNGDTATDLAGLEDYSAYVTVATTDVNSDTAPSTSSKSAIFMDDKVYFSTYYAMSSNETCAIDATYIYYGNGDDLYYCAKGAVNAKKAGEPGDSIYSIAATSDYLLLGTEEGLIHVALTDGVPSGSTSDFSTNAASTLSSYYEVWALLAVDPSRTETGGDLYGATTFSGTSASFSNVCLWGYYPGRGKWNCE